MRDAKKLRNEMLRNYQIKAAKNQNKAGVDDRAAAAVHTDVSGGCETDFDEVLQELDESGLWVARLWNLVR